MKERPILFSGPMILALLAGRKTQTRRAIKFTEAELTADQLELTRMQDGYPEGVRPVFGTADEPNAFSKKCPYGQVGDQMWVRETLFWSFCDDGWCYQAGNGPVMLEEYTAPILLKEKPAIPSIHMPREASRILLEITEVRVERLNDISIQDAVAEGCREDFWGVGEWKYPKATSNSTPPYSCIARSNYASLWQEINGPKSWDANPWVWCVSFKVISNG